MTRSEYLDRLIEAYLESPDTPAVARPRDWAIAGGFFKQGIELATVPMLYAWPPCVAIVEILL